MLMMMKQSRAEHTQQLTPFHTSHIAKLILDALPSLGLAQPSPSCSLRACTIDQGIDQYTREQRSILRNTKAFLAQRHHTIIFLGKSRLKSIEHSRLQCIKFRYCEKTTIFEKIFFLNYLCLVLLQVPKCFVPVQIFCVVPKICLCIVPVTNILCQNKR